MDDTPMRALFCLALSLLLGSTSIAPVAGCGGCYDDEWPTSLSPEASCLTFVAITGTCGAQYFTVTNACDDPLVVAARGTTLATDTEIAAGDELTVLVVADPTTDKLFRTYDVQLGGEPHTLTIDWNLETSN